MGAIFAYNKNKIHSISPALDLFAEMGFSSPASFEFGSWVIEAFPKMVVPSPNYISINGYTLVSTGTPIYKGLDYTDSHNAILQDYLSNSIDYDQLIGQYTIMFCHEDIIEILCDPLGSKHLFTDQTHSMLSSHMLPICQCFDGDLHINRKAFYEKFLTGIIMPPNTLFDEIIQINQQEAERITHENVGIRFIQTSSINLPESRAKGFEESIYEQADTLQHYFELLSIPGKDGIDIGLSGGYDSRLVLACLHKFHNGKIHLHSHSTENVHQKDLTIAKQMAEYVGVPLHTVPTKKLKNSDHIDDVLRKSVLYFDGRSSFSIGGCGEVYTASYRKESTEGTQLTLTGVGGELYRNVFDIGFRNIRFSQFMEEKVFSQSFRKAISDELYHELIKDIISRAAVRLGIDQNSKQPKTIAHRYYCEIMMPDGQGNAIDVYNQVSCCIAPFLKPQIISKGYEAIPFHHTGGEFEGQLIDHIDSGLAEIPSSYGYPIQKRPVKAKIKEGIRTYIPSSIWNYLSSTINRKSHKTDESANPEELYANNETLKEAYSYMTGLFPEINFTYLHQSGEEIREVQFIAMTLYYLRERINVQ